MGADHLTTKRGGSTCGPSLTSTKQQLPTEKTKDMPSSIPAVKKLAGMPLHDAKTKIVGGKK